MKIRMLISLMSLTMLQGCLSVLPEPETPSGLYRLGEIEPSATLTRSLVVRQPEGGRVYGGKALAAEGADGALRLVRGVEWAEPASRMLQIGLLDAFSPDGGLAVAKGMGAPADLELAWRMADFSVSGTTARCELELTLLDGRDRIALMQKRVEANAAAQSNKAADRAHALVQAARDCVYQTADIIAAYDAAN